MNGSRDRTMNLRDVLAGIAFTGLAGIFWLQRDYTSEYGGLLPDAVLYSIGVLGIVLALSGFSRRPKEQATGTRARGGDLVYPVALLLLWFALFPLIGFAVAGVVFFTLTASFMRPRLSARSLLVDAVVAIGTIATVYIVFTMLLHIQLPGLSI